MKEVNLTSPLTPSNCLRTSRLVALLMLAAFGRIVTAQTNPSDKVVTTSYKADIERDQRFPRVLISSRGHRLFRLPLVSAISGESAIESLDAIEVSPVHRTNHGDQTLEIRAQSSLFGPRRFVWTFAADHIEFQQFADSETPMHQVYFLSNGTSGFFDKGTSPGIAGNTIIDAQRYYAPNPTFTNELEHPIEVPQTLGVQASPQTPNLGRAASSHLFAPTLLALAFQSGTTWSSIGIGTVPGKYQFNGFEYSGEHYAGASFWVDYQGRTTAHKYASPVVSIQFAPTASRSMEAYVAWLQAKGFTTKRRAVDASWHRLPIFCGWAEQTFLAGSESEREAKPAREYATQANYSAWIRTLEQRGIPISTVVIDDKWSTTYGGLEVDRAKWPDLKKFVDDQHRKGRHVLLWIPMAHAEGLPLALTARLQGKPVLADVSNPDYEKYLRGRIRSLVQDIGIDGFKEDWLIVPRDFSRLDLASPLFGLEWVHKFQSILFDETHKWKHDAMIESQTPNPLYLDSSDVLRLNDIYSGTRNVTAVMQQRARIAHIAGWEIVDTDNASTTTLDEWWKYMLAQPSIGTPALYFVSATAVTHEQPTVEQWKALGKLWRSYIALRTK